MALRREWKAESSYLTGVAVEGTYASMRATLSQISESSVKPYGSRPTAGQIVKMATGIQLNLNSACVTADSVRFILSIDELRLFPRMPITDRSSSMVNIGAEWVQAEVSNGSWGLLRMFGSAMVN